MDQLLAIADSYGKATIYCTFEFAATMKPAEGWASSDMKNELWHKGWLGDYKGHTVVILPQSLEDITNDMKVVDPSFAYIIPVGTENDDWSRDLQTYKKFGIATLLSHWMCVYKNSNLKKKTR